jgi:CHAD domain-containing protein
MELELVSGSVASLLGFAQALASDLPMAVETRSKAERGVQLLSPAPPRPARAQEAMPPPDGTAADAVAAFARSSLRQIADNADGLLADDDPEWVHQMRIGTRRLRACLALVRDHVPAQLLAPVAEDARWLADALATARDLDVLATETLPAVMAGVRANADAEAGRALRSLAMRIGRRRRSARAHARAAVASPRFARLVLAGAALAATPHLGAAANTPAEAALAADARAFARPLLAARHGRLVRRGERMLDGSPVDRHAARIAAKKLRYATEFFADLFPGKRTRAYRNALADLQDLLGALNDATVAVLRAREFAGADSAPAATLQGYAAARFAQLAPEIAAAWKRFAARRTFWDRR